MKIASVTNTPLDPTLGSGKTVLQWTSGLRRFGHEVIVFEPDAFSRPFPGEFFKRLKFRWDAKSLERRLRKGEFDLIEFYGGEFGWLIARLSRRLRKTLLIAHTNGLELLAQESEGVSAHSHWKHIVKWPIEKLIAGCDRSAFVKADRFAAICDLDAKYIISHGIKPEKQTVVVEPGIDEEYLNSNWDQPKDHSIVCLGSWTERKDTATLVAVVTQLMLADSLLRFDLIGAWNNQYEVLNTFPKELHSRIVVHPRLEKSTISELLSRAKVFYFPSLYEGFGMATAEAMACGCAVVVTPTGFGGTLQDGIEAYVRPFRDIASHVAALQLLISNDQVTRQLSLNGRKRVEQMTWDRQVKRLEMTYVEWCKSRVAI